MSETRKSSRLRSRSSHDQDGNDNGRLRVVHDDEATSLNEYFSESESESDSDNQDNDDDYEDPSVKRPKRKARGKRGAAAKKAKTAKGSSRPAKAAEKIANVGGSRKDQETYVELIRDFQPNELFDIMATSEDVSIEELVRDWLDMYKENRDLFLQEFINFMLCCCGSIARVEQHDVHSNESSNETISELQALFKKQKLHEFHLIMSKNNKRKAKFKPLYGNFVEFMRNLFRVADDVQLLYKEISEDENENDQEGAEVKMVPGNLVIDLLTWLSSFSVCKIRCLRYISSLSLYLFLDFLTEHVVDLEKNYLAKLSKQLSQEQKKKRPNESAIEKIENTIDELQSNKAVVENIIDNIVKLCFVHRFKDVEESIRSESMLHLSIWIKNYPEAFLKVTFLKYFGWLLSDASVDVRQQVLKTLPQMILTSANKKLIDNSAVRQFFERFKERIFVIALKDVDLEVRLHAINVIVEISALGYLEDSEILSISSLIFNETKVKVSSHSKNSRFLAAVAKFFSTVIDQKCAGIKSDYGLPDTIFDLNGDSVIKIGTLAGLLSKSLSQHIDNNKNLDNNTDLKIELLFQASEFLNFYFGDYIEVICQLLTSNSELSLSFLNIDDDEQLQSIEQEILVPHNLETIVLFTTILSGLCHGGAVQSGQPRFKIAKAVLPHLEKLFADLPTHSTNVVTQLLSIFNIFSFEDWIQSGNEKSLFNINEKIVKIFRASHFTDTNNCQKYLSFAGTIEKVHAMNLNELNEVWMKELDTIKLQMSKFLQEKMSSDNLDEQCNEVVSTLYGSYLNKIVALGKVYKIEFDPSRLQLLMNNYFSKIPLFFDACSQETVQQMHYKVLTLIVTWQLQKWTNIFKDSMEMEEYPKPSNEFIQTTASIVERLSTVLVSINLRSFSETSQIFNALLLKMSIANSLIDIVSSFKIFELSLPKNETGWTESIQNHFPYYFNDGINEIFQQVFLFLESICAKELDVDIRRLAGEDISFNEFENNMVFKDPESELLLFVIKLKGLMKLRLCKGDLTERITLNKEVFGPLYESIVDNSIFERSNEVKILHKDNTKKNSTIRRASIASIHGSDELDPIEETQENDDAPPKLSMVAGEEITTSEI